MIVVAIAAMPAFAQFQESITVVRHLVNVRVTDASGKAIRDLTAEDFTAKIDQRLAHVESATWVGRSAQKTTRFTPPSKPDVAVPQPDLPIEEPSGRFVVVFILTDSGRDATRIKGQLRFNVISDRLLELLQPDDRVAVLSYDSHLKLRLDFTFDRDAIRRAVQDSIRIERVTPPPSGPEGASLARYLDAEAMLRVTSGEAAFLMIARAFDKIEGDKTMLFAGWGMGSMIWGPGVRGGSFVLPREWNEAIGMLQRDRVPVIALNTGIGGQLAEGMKQTAETTGGLYAFVGGFPDQLVTRVEGALAGYYELVLRTDESLKSGRHPLDIRAKRRGTTVFAAPFINVAALD